MGAWLRRGASAGQAGGRGEMMQPLSGLQNLRVLLPRVATQNGGASRPWADMRNPFGVVGCARGGDRLPTAGVRTCSKIDEQKGGQRPWRILCHYGRPSAGGL